MQQSAEIHWQLKLYERSWWGRKFLPDSVNSDAGMLREILNVALIYNLTWTKKTGTLSLMTVINNEIYFFSKASFLRRSAHASTLLLFASLAIFFLRCKKKKKSRLPKQYSFPNNILSTISSSASKYAYFSIFT